MLAGGTALHKQNLNLGNGEIPMDQKLYGQVVAILRTLLRHILFWQTTAVQARLTFRKVTSTKNTSNNAFFGKQRKLNQVQHRILPTA